MNIVEGFQQLKELVKETQYKETVGELEEKYLKLDQDQRHYGPAPQTTHDINKVLEEAIHIGLELGVSFNNLCGIRR